MFSNTYCPHHWCFRLNYAIVLLNGQVFFNCTVKPGCLISVRPSSPVQAISFLKCNSLSHTSTLTCELSLDLSHTPILFSMCTFEFVALSNAGFYPIICTLPNLGTVTALWIIPITKYKNSFLCDASCSPKCHC